MIDLRVHLGNDRGFGSRSDRPVQRQIAGRMSHNLDEEEAFMAGSRIAQFVHRLDDRIERRIVADRSVRTAQVVIDRTRQADDRHIELLSENTGALQRTVPADHHQRIDTAALHILISPAAPFRGHKLLAAGRLQHRAALLDDIAHGIRLQVDDFVIDPSLITAPNTFYGIPVIDRRTRHGTDRGIHPGSIAPRSQHSDTLNCSHTFSFY